ncbi:MAG TPA: VWA domain-containing protein [Blastocatellia bacterium]|nr:VWA domain-containing protein [Blastocatellia bacterium]
MVKSVTLVTLFFLVLPFGAVQTRTPKKSAPAQQTVHPKQKAQEPDSETPESDETLKLGTDLVTVLFSAADANNRVVSDIRQQEISVLEDGREQQIFTFKRESNLPISIAVVIDLSGSQEYTFPQEKSAAAYFLRSVVRPGKDSASILTFKDDVDLVQGLTSKIDTLERALDEVQHTRRFGTLSSRNQATAMYDALYITVDEILGREDNRSYLRRADPMDYAVKRRAIILLTDGVDNASSRKLDEAIDRAWRSGVMVFSIGIGDRFRFEGIREDILSRISSETGGRAFFPRGPDELAAHFRQIEDDLRSQYLVAYVPANTARDGSFRRIDVRVNDRTDIRLNHRRGYYAPADDVKK